MLQNDYSWYMLKLSKLGAFSSAFLKAIEKIKRRYEVLLVTVVKCTGDMSPLSQIWYSSIIQTISFSQTSWQRHLFLANASTAMHQSKGSSQWHGTTKFTKFSIILWCSCWKVWRSEDYPVGVADKQGVRGVLCTTRCKSTCAKNVHEAGRELYTFQKSFDRCHGHQTNIQRPLLTPRTFNHKARTSQIRADIEMQEIARNARTVSSRSGQKQTTKQHCTNSNTAPTALRNKLTNIRLITEYLKQ